MFITCPVWLSPTLRTSFFLLSPERLTARLGKFWVPHHRAGCGTSVFSWIPLEQKRASKRLGSFEEEKDDIHLVLHPSLGASPSSTRLRWVASGCPDFSVHSTEEPQNRPCWSLPPVHVPGIYHFLFSSNATLRNVP